jgi:hypothetical protein
MSESVGGRDRPAGYVIVVPVEMTGEVWMSSAVRVAARLAVVVVFGILAADMGTNVLPAHPGAAVLAEGDGVHTNSIAGNGGVAHGHGGALILGLAR